tara:strand:- start:420 stop:986 length:567 start_codon:yes stop_codon:yes gene_type:complete
MAQNAHNVSTFASQVQKGGSRPHLFEVTGNIGSGTGTDLEKQTSFLIKAAQLPASSLGIIEVPYRGRKVKIPGDRTFAEWTITVISDGDFRIREAFEKWSGAINEHVDNTSDDIQHRPVSASDVYQDWHISQLDRAENVIRTYDFTGCWPSEIGAMEVNYETTDTIHEFTVTLQYTYWTVDTGGTIGA